MTRQREHDRRRREAGWRRVDVWLDPETQAALEALQRRSDGTDASEQSVIRYAIEFLAQAATARPAQSTHTPDSAR